MGKIIHIFSEMRRHARAGHLSVIRQLQEMFLLWWKNRIGPGYYEKVGLWQRHISWHDKTAYISEQTYWQGIRKRNPVHYQMITRCKTVYKALLQQNHLPSPHYYGFFHPTRGCDNDGHALCAPEQLANYIRVNKIERFVAKDPEGHGGQGLVAVRCRESVGAIELAHWGQDDWQDIAVFCENHLPEYRETGFQLEQHIDQHEWYRSVNPTSVNTIRLNVVWRDDQSKPELLCALFRCGRKGALVDNANAGGFLAKLDHSTGELGYLQTKKGGVESQGSAHPDSGVQIEGVTLPLFAEAKALALKAMKSIPAMKCIAFDIAVTPDGPTIIEANERPDYLLFPLTGVPPSKAVQPLSDHPLPAIENQESP